MKDDRPVGVDHDREPTSAAGSPEPVPAPDVTLNGDGRRGSPFATWSRRRGSQWGARPQRKDNGGLPREGARGDIDKTGELRIQSAISICW